MSAYDVELRLKSRQNSEGETLTTDQTLRGRLEPGEEGWTLSYREGEDSGLGNTVTTLTAAPGKVVLERRGEVNCRMVFRTGRRYFTDYVTPYGAFPMELLTWELAHSLEGDKGSLFLRYGLKLGGGDMGETRLHLEFERKNP